MSAAKAAPKRTVVPLAAITVVERGGPDHTERRRITGEALGRLIEINHVDGPGLTTPDDLVVLLEGLAGLVEGLGASRDTPQELRRAARCVHTLDPVYRAQLAEKYLSVELPAAPGA